ncbi:MAG: M56 family metallopeptidase [Clostridia bacterium]|nr:M56 family metallopeptidase [Clostridia bacterium]
MWNGKLAGLLMLVYVAGVLLVLGYFLYRNLYFAGEMKKNRIEPISGEMLESYRALCRRMKIKPLPVYLSDPLPSACLVGSIRPYIALPAALNPEDTLLTLEHELCHYKNRDHLWSLLRLLCCALHWFNPLVWLAAGMSRTDMEMHIDERVTGKKNEEEKKQYAALLVTTSARRTAPSLPILATGMTMNGKRLKERVKHILSAKKTVAAISILFCIAAVILLIGAFSTGEFLGSPSIPAFKPGMLPPARPVHTDEDAIQLAKEVAALPQVNAKLRNGKWVLITEGDKPGVKVAAWQANGKNTFIVRMYEDGGLYGFGDYTVGYHSDERREFFGKPVWDEELIDFVEGWVLAMNPQLEGKINEKMLVGHFIQDGERYAQVQIGVDIDGYGHIGATIKLNPTFQIVEFSPGNG